MMEKQNRIQEKTAAGDAGVFDDIVDAAAGKLAKVHTTGKKRGAADARPAPEDGRTASL